MTDSAHAFEVSPWADRPAGQPYVAPGTRLRALLRRVAKALTASAVATGVDVATLLALVRAIPIAAGVAAAIGCLAGGAANFLLCRNWVFRGRPAPGSRALPVARGGAARQLVAYSVLVVGGSALLSGLVVQVGTARIGLPVLVAKAVAAVLVFGGWNYPISARLVFRNGQAT